MAPMAVLPQLNVAFARFWPGFDPRNNRFSQILGKSFDLRFDAEPDVVFYSVFSGDLPPGEYVKVFYTGECVRPPWDECDWAFSFDYDDNPRHFRLPVHVFLEDVSADLIKTSQKVADWRQGRFRFCNFVYSKRESFREGFFRRLSQRKAVDAPGMSMNNMPPIGGGADPRQSRYSPDWSNTKLDFLRSYRFTIAFENQSSPGYTTEKIFHAMQAGSIPIYWGDPLIHLDFNTKSFVNYHEYESVVTESVPDFLLRIPFLRRLANRFYIRPKTTLDVVKRVMEIERNDALYLQYLAEPWLAGNQVAPVFDPERLERRLIEIANDAKREAAVQFPMAAASE